MAFSSDRSDRLRQLLLFVLLLGILGTGTELILLEHMEDWWQWVPLVALSGALVLVLWALVKPGRGVLKVLRLLMALFLVIGATGLTLHFRGNVEFELELHATMRGFELVWEALKGATPALAPGTMIQLGLVGLVYCYRHPMLGSPSAPEEAAEAADGRSFDRITNSGDTS